MVDQEMSHLSWLPRIPLRRNFHTLHHQIYQAKSSQGEMRNHTRLSHRITNLFCCHLRLILNTEAPWHWQDNMDHSDIKSRAAAGVAAEQTCAAVKLNHRASSRGIRCRWDRNRSKTRVCLFNFALFLYNKQIYKQLLGEIMQWTFNLDSLSCEPQNTRQSLVSFTDVVTSLKCNFFQNLNKIISFSSEKKNKKTFATNTSTKLNLRFKYVHYEIKLRKIWSNFDINAWNYRKPPIRLFLIFMSGIEKQKFHIYIN